MHKKKGFTLLELCIAVGVLALVSVFVLQMFVLSRNTSMKARDLSRAVLSAQSAVESFKAVRGDPDKLTALPGYETASVEASAEGFLTATVFYDTDWMPVKGTGDYSLTLSAVPEAEGGWSLTAAVTRHRAYPLESPGDRELYSMEAVEYWDNREGAGT